MADIIVIDDIRATLCVSLQEHLCSTESDLHALLRQFHNLLAKKISPRPRRTHLSEEIQRHPLFLREKKQAIERIRADIETGSDLSKYLSEKSTQLGHHDKSLAHFGVHHFHLGDALEALGARKGRMKGTKSLLFIRILDDDAYLLDILDHGMHTGFLNIRLFRLMHRNWPHSVEDHRIKNAIGLAQTYTDMEAAECWRTMSMYSSNQYPAKYSCSRAWEQQQRELRCLSKEMQTAAWTPSSRSSNP